MSGEAPSEYHVSVLRTYLEMTERPNYPIRPTPDGAMILRAENPTLSFYRYLYREVGRDYVWTDLLRKSDDELRAEIAGPDQHIYVLYVGGVPAGFAHISWKEKPNSCIEYFGLIPDFIGRGYGGYFLRWVINKVWEDGTDRLWLHTCTLDHPNALPNYQKQRFYPFKTEQIWQDTRDEQTT